MMIRPYLNRTERLKLREIYLVRKLEELKRNYISKSQPFAEELNRLREHRDPRTIEVNGVTYMYTGPKPDYKLPDEMPENDQPLNPNNPDEEEED